MTRTRYTLSALAAIALVSTLAGSPAEAQKGHHLGLDHTLTNKESGVISKGATTQKLKSLPGTHKKEMDRTSVPLVQPGSPSANNPKPGATAGDVLIDRWQRSSIGK